MPKLDQETPQAYSKKGAFPSFYRFIKSASFSFLLTISCRGKLHVRVLNMAHYFASFFFFLGATIFWGDLYVLTSAVITLVSLFFWGKDSSQNCQITDHLSPKVQVWS